jgi:predicted DNA-binding transcriptional regulator YafY
MKQAHRQLCRLYWIDAALQRQPGPNAASLARELGVSRSTIHRDLQLLRSEYRAPLSFDPTAGAYGYARPFRPDLPTLPAEEALGTYLRQYRERKGASAGKQVRTRADAVLVAVRFDRSVAKEVLASGLIERHQMQMLTDGGIEAHVAVRNPDSLLLDLLRWAPNFDVTAPPWVRRRLPQLLRRLLRQLEGRSKKPKLP